MTIHNTRYYHICRRRVPLAEVYSSISKNFRIACTNETGQSSIEATRTHSRVEEDKINPLPDPVTWRVGRCSSEMALAPRHQMRGLETISTTRHNGRGPDSSLKRQKLDIRLYTDITLWTVIHWMTVRKVTPYTHRSRRIPSDF